jgi:hypothetical protein
VDTPLLDPSLRLIAGIRGTPLLSPDEVADALDRVLAGGRTGEAWIVRAGEEPRPHLFAT